MSAGAQMEIWPFSRSGLVHPRLTDQQKSPTSRKVSEKWGTRAVRALEFAALTHSGFRYHADVGLVGTSYDKLKHELRRLSERNQA